MKHLILLLLVPVISFAGPNNSTTDNSVTTNNYYSTEGSVITTNNTVVSGVALSIAASQHQFDFGTYSWQGSVALGSYEERTAFSFGVAKRLCKDCMMLNGSFGVEEGKVGYGAGLNWRFK